MSSQVFSELSSFDYGNTFQVETGNNVFSMDFSKSDEIIYHKFSVSTILDTLAGFGGMFAILKAFFGFLTEFINEKVIKAKFIRSLYFT